MLFLYLAFAAAAPSEGVSAGLLEEQAPELDEIRNASLNSTDSRTLSAPAVVPESLPLLTEHLRPSPEENVAGAMDSELPAENAEEAVLSTYDRQLQKEIQARRRMARAALMLVFSMILPFILCQYAMWYAAKQDIGQLPMGPDRTLSELLPKGIHAAIFMILAIPSLLMPIMSVYTTVSFLRWLRHFIISSILNRKEGSAAGGYSNTAEASDLAAAATAPSLGSEPQ
ncbi:hypothetical protein Emag_003757 [Eimeria magna]